jgi:hypothetical protein
VGVVADKTQPDRNDAFIVQLELSFGKKYRDRAINRRTWPGWKMKCAASAKSTGPD